MITNRPTKPLCVKFEYLEMRLRLDHAYCYVKWLLLFCGATLGSESFLCCHHFLCLLSVSEPIYNNFYRKNLCFGFHMKDEYLGSIYCQSYLNLLLFPKHRLNVIFPFSQDCTDGSDEKNCTAVSCPDNKFSCPQVDKTKRQIPLSIVSWQQTITINTLTSYCTVYP